MQRFFGMALARRASRQATVSARAIEFLSLLSGAEAQALERIASFTLVTTKAGDEGGVLQSLPSVSLDDPDRERKQRASDALTMYVQPLKQGLFGSLGVFVETGWAHSFHYWKSGPGTREFRIAGRYFKVTGRAEHLDSNGSCTSAPALDFLRLVLNWLVSSVRQRMTNMSDCCWKDFGS